MFSLPLYMHTHNTRKLPTLSTMYMYIYTPGPLTEPRGNESLEEAPTRSSLRGTGSTRSTVLLTKGWRWSACAVRICAACRSIPCEVGVCGHAGDSC